MGLNRIAKAVVKRTRHSKRVGAFLLYYERNLEKDLVFSKGYFKFMYK